MKTLFYPRLALSNIKKNKQIYIPYLISSTFTVMMYYVIHALSKNPGLAKTTASFILDLGSWVVTFFSFIFIFYVNSFVIKRRKKEVALYNILGMEKKHVMFMMFFETLLTTFIALSAGIGIGILFSRFMFLVLLNIVHLQTQMSFSITFDSILMTCFIYSIIFFITYLFNIIQIKLANPIELLRGGQNGEKEPKTKWLITLIGIITLGSGYYIAQTIENPIAAIFLFFIAVILVIIGTYCLFTAGSITILKALKKNKSFYYQTRHFTSVSQMLYRMKQNAVGLASICILCTCILVMMSSTVSLYLGVEDSTKLLHKEDYRLTIYPSEDSTLPSKTDINLLTQTIQNKLQENHISLKNCIIKRIYETGGSFQDHNFIVGLSEGYYTDFFAMTLEDYNSAYNKHETLKDNEIFLVTPTTEFQNSFQLNSKEYVIKDIVNDKYFLETMMSEEDACLGMVFKDETTLKNAIYNEYLTRVKPHIRISMEYKANTDEKLANDVIEETINQYKSDNEIMQKYGLSLSSQYNTYYVFLDAYGSLLFLGLFLGILFLMAAILIMYYKQLSEGYEDQKRFEIMQNVGMSTKEVKQTIRSQVLIFFFLPLIVAVIHMAFAFKMIVKMFGLLIISKEILFVYCTIIAIILLVIIYSIVYSLTAKTYYRIVKH